MTKFQKVAHIMNQSLKYCNPPNKHSHSYSITRQQILNFSKLKKFADDNFKVDENCRKFSIRVENTVGKGEIAHHEQFLLFPQCFQKACFPGASKSVIVWEWAKQNRDMEPLFCTQFVKPNVYQILYFLVF